MQGSSVGKIALGVYLGGMGVVATVTLMLMLVGGLMMRQQQAAGEQIAREYKKAMEGIIQQPPAQHRYAPQTPPQPQLNRQLPEGYRCIGGQTVKRVDNGWEQVSGTCQN